MTTRTYGGYGLRNREPVPSRVPRSGERFEQMLANAERGIAQPFVGITADGIVVPGLFELGSTGVSTEPIRSAAERFLAMLIPPQRALASFPLDGDAWRRWSNIHPFTMRHGVLLEDVNDTGREAALNILRATLSAGGFTTARDIMRLNYTIGEITDSWTEYGEWVYWLSIFGTPSATEPWGWQIDGHHLNLNCLVLGDQIVLSPMFMGSEPVVAEIGKFAGTRVFDAEERDGLALVRTLSEAQRAQAMAVDSILAADVAPGRKRYVDGRVKNRAYYDNAQVPYEGISANDLSTAQRDQLVHLVELYMGRLRSGHDRVRMQEVERHLGETRFLWMGGMQDDSVFYYRVHSPVILLEFDHQRGVALDNDDPARTHIHTIVRTPNGNDYGKDLLAQHYALHHSGH